ncbi:restriction endonuclease subunit S [Clostridium sp.]|uniref:restriction endonuclease subunit S n=1 Tax=Clostridium sp. TaxID=1506 RepID=UPI002FCC2126
MKIAKLVEYAKVSIGQSAPQSIDDFSDRGNPFIRAGSLDSIISGKSLDLLELISDESAKKNKLKLYPVNSVVFAKSGMSATKNRVYKLTQPCYVVSHLAILSPNEKTNPEYLRLVVQHAKPSTLIKDPAYPSISQRDIENFILPFPPLDDQNRIVAVLTRAEKLISKRKESIEALDKLLKSIFIEMFGNSAEMLQQPKTKLNKFINFLTSGSRGWAQYYSETGDIFIRINNVRDACFKLDDMIYVNPPNNAEAARTKVKVNDLLFSITADLGRTAVVNEMLDGAFINQHLALIRLDNDRINPIFVAWYFAMPYGKSIVLKKNREGVKAGLNFDDIRGFEIVTPPLSLQNKFASIVEKVETIKAKYQEGLTELEDLYGSLSQRAFKGELDLSNVPMEKENETIGLPGDAEVTIPIADELKVSPKYSDVELRKIIQSLAEETFNFDTLMSAIQKALFEEMPEYEDLKKQIYNMLEGINPLLSQTFDKVKKEIVLRVNL